MKEYLEKFPWRRLLNDLLLITGVILLLWAALISLNPLLASKYIGHEDYLHTGLEVSLPLPDLSNILNTEPVTDDVFFPMLYETITPTPQPTPTLMPTPVPRAGPVIRLVIPSINVNRAVVPLKQYRDNNGQVQYDTNALFANGNRLDLVGQLATSMNPGDGSNIVLVGHNYNRGWYAWEGVFVNLKKLKTGDKVVLHTKDGGKYTYHVKKVVQVPWVNKNTKELNKHLRHLGPTAHERVTLVTCGGAFGSWSARIYVVAK